MKKNKNIPLNLKEQINSRIGLICSIVVMLLLVLVFHQLDYQLIQKPADQAAKEAAKQKEEAEAAAKAPEISTATVVAVGDNLFHDSLIESGKSDSGTWNYDKIYENVKDESQAADIAMVDQETVFTTDHDAVSGYPSFATPTEVGDALINAGFDVIESATNHIDDYGYDYMAQTLNYWKTSHPDVPVLGIHETEEDANSVKVLEVNGIKISFLDYTYGTNNSGAGEGKEYMIDIFEKDKVASMIQKAKENSDVLIFVAHWGKEMEPMPTEYEKEWATFLMQQGVDVVIGGHPHTLQPYGTMSDKEGHSMLIFYSLGNFIFDTDYQRVHLYTDVGVLLKLIFTEEAIDFEAIGIRIIRGDERIDIAPLPAIFTDIPAAEYELLAPLSAKAFVAEDRRKMIYLEPERFTDASEDVWNGYFFSTEPDGYFEGAHMDFHIIVPFSEKAEEGAWKKSTLEPVKEYILRQL